MVRLSIFRMGWQLLDATERRQALGLLVVIVTAALFNAGMIGAVMPFLSVLSDPTRIETNDALRWAFNTFGFSSDYGFLIFLGVFSLFFILMSSGVQILKTYTLAYFTNLRAHSISCRLLAQYLGQPYEFFLDKHSGDMSSNILAEAAQIVSNFYKPAAELVSSFFAVIAVLAVLFYVQPNVAGGAILILGAAYGITYLAGRGMVARLGRVRTISNGQRYRIAGEALGGVKDIKLLGRERAYLDRFFHPSLGVARSDAGLLVVSHLPRFIVEAVAFSGIILLSILLVEPETFSSSNTLAGIVPLLGLFALAGQRIMPDLQRLYVTATQLRFSVTAVEKVYDTLFKTIKVEEPPVEPPKGIGLTSNLELRSISYSYPGSSDKGLTDVSLNVSAGEKIGIVGSTGSGKTTLADVILGLLKPDSGDIFADGTQINDENVRAWQQSVGYVPQGIFLVDATVSENIALGIAADEIDETRVRQCADIAQLTDFVLQELPNGFQTEIGELGVRLSGGQRQRIGIARALYNNADVIVFDEATSALDNLTEKDVMTAINALSDEKTIFLIAHRLTTVRVCDRIILLNKGRIEAIGSWSTLMKKSERFRTIVESA